MCTDGDQQSLFPVQTCLLCEGPPAVLLDVGVSHSEPTQRPML